MINGMGLGDDKVHTFDVKIGDFLSESSFPFTIPPEASSEASSSILAKLFISQGRITDLASLLKLKIIQKLAPGLGKKGYEDTAHTAAQETRQPAPDREHDEPTHNPLRDEPLPPYAQPHPFGDPLASQPRRPYPAGDFPPPGFEDEYEINRPPGRGGPGYGRRPLNIGERDLYPPGLGPHDPLRGGGYGPGGGLVGGGMHPTFDDPMFGGDGGIGAYDSRFVIALLRISGSF